MRSIIYSEMAPDFIVQGLGLHPDGRNSYVGKVGRQEVALFLSSESLVSQDGDIQILVIGLAPGGKFRPGDVLMAGSDELLDRTFMALDEMEQRGVVVNLTPAEDPSQIYVSKEQLQAEVQLWREKKVPYICLLMAEPISNDDQAKLVTLVRKIIN